MTQIFRIALTSIYNKKTRRYSAKEWIRLPFSAGEISKQAVGNKIQLRE
ncbi:hypothetical protein [Psychrobacter sp. DAB_AL62B]|nr:hypothetical protein [Psychrobacter sp. DAB_AL62B]